MFLRYGFGVWVVGLVFVAKQYHNHLSLKKQVLLKIRSTSESLSKFFKSLLKD
mgnify:CR=1 FL=1